MPSTLCKMKMKTSEFALTSFYANLLSKTESLNSSKLIIYHLTCVVLADRLCMEVLYPVHASMTMDFQVGLYCTKKKKKCRHSHREKTVKSVSVCTAWS